MESIIRLSAFLGFLIILLFLMTTIYFFLTGLRTHFTPNQIPFTTKFGKWAIVTGSTDGIGRAYAFELAKRGLNLVLISRTQSKLDQVAKEIESRYLVQTKTIAVDFCDVVKALEKVEKELADLPIGILVNNVGKQYEYPMYLSEVPEKEIWDIVNVNIGATTLMTRLILPKMVERKQGAIVNISSGSECQPLPLMTVYAATKVYIKSFSAALQLEYANKGIIIQHLSPLFINTKMNDFSRRLRVNSLFVPDAEIYASSAVNTLGRLSQSTGYWLHGIQAYLISSVPVAFASHLGFSLNKLFRRDYFRKLQIKRSD